MGDGHALQEAPDVEAAAADKDGDTARGKDVIHSEVGLLKIEGEVEGIVGIHEVVEMVWDAGEVLGRGFGSADIHVPVDLPAVGVDDLAAEGLGEVERQGALARGRGSDDGDKSGQGQPGRAWEAAATMPEKSAGSRLAPPTRAPSMSSDVMKSRMLEDLTLPP